MVPVNMIRVEVAYALPDDQRIISLEVSAGTTIEETVRLSGILDLFPEINLSAQKVGVFSKIKALTDIVHAGDRIEIYRPLTIDPKDARRAKAKQSSRRASR